MAIELQLRTGTTIQNDAFVGVEGELTYDSESHGLRIHDGSKAGGYELPVLVAVQRPTAGNNYTWYRKWSDGWVEQGGKNTTHTTTVSITLPIAMSDANYTVSANNIVSSANDRVIQVTDATSSTAVVFLKNNSDNDFYWEVKGMAA